MADLVLVFFSRASLPSRWPRAQWEDALVNEPAEEGVRIAFVRCDDCVPPRVLSPMFEANRVRDIKRWVRDAPPGDAPAPEHVPDLEVLGIAIADRAGKETTPSYALADEFARVFRPDFDAVVRLETGERRLAAIAGDLGGQLGLRLEGGLPDNLERLRTFCEAKRLLIVQEGGEVPGTGLRRPDVHTGERGGGSAFARSDAPDPRRVRYRRGLVRACARRRGRAAVWRAISAASPNCTI